ncbi:MAG: hypothetical protein WBM45_14295 [Woeseiaceae bacterium]
MRFDQKEERVLRDIQGAPATALTYNTRTTHNKMVEPMRLFHPPFAYSVVALLMCLPAHSLAAESGTKPDHAWRVHVGGFVPSVDSTITINGETVTPPPLDIEDDLGVEDSKTVPWGGVSWNFARRHSLEIEYFRLNRDGSRGFVDELVEVGDYIVESGAISTTSKLGLARLTYGYHILERERSEIQIKGGLHIANFSAAFQLLGNVCDISMGESPPCLLITSSVAESESVTAPLPHIGGSWLYEFTDQWAFRFQAIGFAVKLDSIDGSILELDADLTWQPWEHFGLGLGTRYFKVEV